MIVPIRMFGGKGMMYKQIIKHFPKSYNVYIEPFAGSFSVGIRKGIVPLEIYNDIDKNLYSLFKVISNKNLFNLFKEKCDLLYYSSDLRKESINILKRNNLSELDRAFHFFVVNRMSHNGIGGISINLIVRRNMSKSVSDLLSTIDGLGELHQRMSRVIILNRDAFELLDKFNQSNVFFYSDPPYHQSTRGSARYKHDFTDRQHNKFIDTLIKSSKAKHLISGYKCDTYKKLEENGFERIDFTINTISGNLKPKTKIESLWRNYTC